MRKLPRPVEIRRRARRPALAAAVTLAVASLLAACSHSSAPPLPQPGTTLDRFASEWSSQSWGAMAALVLHPPADFATTNRAVLTELDAARVHVQPGTVTQHGSSATAPITEQVSVAHLGTVVLHGTARLVIRHRHWLVQWSPAAIDTRFHLGDRFEVTPIFGNRGSILADDGSTISAGASTVTVGVQGSYVKQADKTQLLTALETAGATPSAAESAVAQALAQPSAFVPVVTVSESRYEQLKPQIYSVPGTVFRANGATSASPWLAALVGTLGSPSKSQVKTLGWPYTTSSLVGVSGIEQTEESVLAGKAGADVTLVDAGGSTVATIAHFADTAGSDVTTSIDPSMQTAAENALSGVNYQAALVAIRASTGQVVAAVNTSSLGSTDLALNGQQPPGSTFKVITSTALIEKGLTPKSAASCPSVFNVDGENFHNAGGENPVSNILGAFTESCNTAFIQLTMSNLGDSSLHDTATQYDIGITPQLGAPAFGGSVPVATGETDLAASGIGQAEVTLNPLDMATVAAAVDTGIVREPRLVKGTPDDSAPTHTVPASVVSDLHTMMAAVVASGTAAGTGLPPGTYAKTGTAEYGTGNPLPVDAWLMGFNGDIAFAMCLINAPGDGGPTDGPIVAKFLDAINTAS